MSDQIEIDNLREAREQADEYSSFAQSGKIRNKVGEEFTVPNLLLLDDDQQAAFNKLQHLVNQCDRHPDTVIPERLVKLTDPETGEVTETVVKPHTVPGAFIEPYQKDGELLEPPYNVQLAQILLGEDEYKRFKDGGGSSQKLMLLLRKMREQTEERAAADSKSNSGGSPVESVPAGD